MNFNIALFQCIKCRSVVADTSMDVADSGSGDQSQLSSFVLDAQVTLSSAPRASTLYKGCSSVDIACVCGAPLGEKIVTVDLTHSALINRHRWDAATVLRIPFRWDQVVRDRRHLSLPAPLLAAHATQTHLKRVAVHLNRHTTALHDQLGALNTSAAVLQHRAAKKAKRSTSTAKK